MQLNTTIKLLQPFCTTDEAREYMLRPFGFTLNSIQYAAATDGHRASFVRCPEAYTLIVPGAPPVQHVIPSGAMSLLGHIREDALAGAKAIPRKWHSTLELGHNRCRFSASKQGKKAIIEGAPVDWVALDGLHDPRGINLQYMLDAVAFIGTQVVSMWQGADANCPYVFTPTDASHFDSELFAIVMPVRV